MLSHFETFHSSQDSIGRLWWNVVATASVRWCLRLLLWAAWASVAPGLWAAWASVAPGLLPVGGRPVGGLRLRARAVPVGFVAARPRCRAGWACVPLPFVPPRSAAGDEADLSRKKGKRRAAAAEHTADTVPACLPLALLARCWLRLATSWVCWVGLVQFQYSCKASVSERSTSF